MSLLLDALKKAAEKKAQKNADNTSVNDSEVVTRAQQPEGTSADETHVDKTVAVTETRVDTTSLNETHIEATELNATQVDSTELDATTGQDRTAKYQSEPEKSVNESGLGKGGEKSPGESTQELDVRKLDLSKLAAEQAEAAQHADDEKTLSFIDDEEILIDVNDSIESDTDGTDETVVLTPDDITEFLGDGHHPEPSEPPVTPVPSTPSRPQVHGSDDTTITNSDSLSLTNIEQDSLELDSEDDQLIADETKTATATYGGYDGRLSLQGDEPLPSDDDDSPTMMNADTTAPSVDIEKLTNDETVTIRDSTFTRTFAPDNYDRTLMKLSDQDVSRIFPGMRSESDNVMTPDYAKKIFVTKSKGVKNYYYKVYAGVALSILLIVVVLGLFEIQSESETIDNSLIALKRDPMPGVIKPKVQQESVNLFSSSPPVDNQAIKVVERASMAESEAQLEASADTETDSANSPIAEDPAIGEQSTEGLSQSGGIAKPTATKSVEPVSTGKTTTAKATRTPLSISSNNRVSEKDLILNNAYSAYEEGRIDEARRLYQQVLSLDADNRDALLGRAAIHVLDNQFERAITLYQKLLLANPKDDLAMTSLISVASVDPQVGETELKKLLTDIPESPYLHFALGNMYGSQKRWAEAQTEYFTALQYKPEDPNYAYNLAISLEHLQKPDTAVTFYQRALENKSKALTTFSESLVMQRIEVLNQ